MTNSAAANNAPITDARELQVRRERLGAFFASYREKAGLTMAAVSKELLLEDSEMLAKYEAGRVAIPLDDIFALSNLLNIPPEDVMDMINGLYSNSADRGE